MMSRGFASTKVLSFSAMRNYPKHGTLVQICRNVVQRRPYTKSQLKYQPPQLQVHGKNITKTVRVYLKTGVTLNKKDPLKPSKLLLLMAAGSRLPLDMIKSGTQFLRKKMGKKFVLVSAGALGCGTTIAYLKHREEAPITGRKRLMLISRDEAMQQGARMARKFESRYDASMLTSDKDLDRVLAKLLEANPDITAHIPAGDWKAVVIKQPDIDAASFPHGTLYIFEGMLNFATTDDQRAFLLGHEISHVVLSHAAELASWKNFKRNFLKITYTAFINLTGLGNVGTDWAFDQIFDMTTNSPHEEQIDQEADAVGLLFTIKACYNPQAGVTFFNKLAKHELEEVNACIKTVAKDEEDPGDSLCSIQQLPSWKEKVFRNADRAKYIRELQKEALGWRDAVGTCPDLPGHLPSEVDHLHNDVDTMLALLDNERDREGAALAEEVDRLVARVKKSYHQQDPRTIVHRAQCMRL